MDAKKKLILEREEEHGKPRIVYPHGTPVTRRDMLKAGVIQFAASMTLPSIYQLLASSSAEAADCSASSANSMAVYVNVNLSGGAAMSAMYVPLDIGGNLLPSYSILGLGNPAQLTMVKQFGNVTFPGNNISGLLTGITGEATAAALANTAFVAMPLQSQDDSNMNKLDITGAVTKAGLKGISLPNLGNRKTLTGGNNQPAYIIPPAPLVVSSFNDISSAISVAGSLANLKTPQKGRLFTLINNLTATQAADLASLTGGAQLSTLANCGSGVNKDLVSSGSTGTNPLDNTAFATVWNITNATNKSSQDFVFATMLYNALKGNAGTVTLDMGGFDYHGNSRTDTNDKDETAGVVVGRVLESAKVMGKKIFMTVTSDGAVGAPASNSAAVGFQSDRGSGSSAFILAYDPKGRPATNGTQIGGMTVGQAANDQFVTGGNPQIAAAALFANYMAFNGRLGDVDSIIPRVFSPDQLTKVVKVSG